MSIVLRTQCITSTQDKLQIHFSHATDLLVEVHCSESGVSTLHLGGFALKPENLLAFQVGRRFPSSLSECKVLKNPLKHWRDEVAKFNHFLEENASQNPKMLSFTWRTPMMVHNVLRLQPPERPRTLFQMRQRVQEDLTLCHVLPLLEKHVRQTLVGKRRKGDKIMCFVVEQKFKVLAELHASFKILMTKKFRRAVLRVLDETCLVTDVGILITQFLEPAFL